MAKNKYRVISELLEQAVQCSVQLSGKAVKIERAINRIGKILIAILIIAVAHLIAVIVG